MLAHTILDRRGFILTELMLVMGLTAVVAGIAVPVTRHATDGMRLDLAAREVERQLQTARLRSASTNRTFILRLNCPAAGETRVVEVTGVQATDAMRRGSLSPAPATPTERHRPTTGQSEGCIRRSRSAAPTSSSHQTAPPRKSLDQAPDRSRRR